MTDHNQIFLSYSRDDLDAAASLRVQLEKRGLNVFKDDQSIREGDLWLNRLQEAVDACTGFVVLVGRDGIGRWIGTETQTALSRLSVVIIHPSTGTDITSGGLAPLVAVMQSTDAGQCDDPGRGRRSWRDRSPVRCVLG